MQAFLIFFSILFLLPHPQSANKMQAKKLLYESKENSDEINTFEISQANFRNMPGPFILFTNIGEARTGKSQTLNFFIEKLTEKQLNIFQVSHSPLPVTEGADIFILQWGEIIIEYQHLIKKHLNCTPNIIFIDTEGANVR